MSCKTQEEIVNHDFSQIRMLPSDYKIFASIASSSETCRFRSEKALDYCLSHVEFVNACVEEIDVGFVAFNITGKP